MRVGVYQSVRSLAIAQVPEPTADAAGAVLAVKACGICGSDLHAYTHGAWIVEGAAMGHEYAAEVLEVGAEVTDLAPGDRVAVNPFVSCGACEACQHGRHNMCSDIRSASAGFADRASIPVAAEGTQLFKMPDEMGWEEGAFLEPTSVSVRAVNLVDLDPDEPAVVIGLGAIGQGVVQVLRHRGVKRIIAVDVSPMRLAVAARGGAHLTLDASKVDVFEEICRDLGETSSAYHPRSSRAGVVFECSGAGKAMESTIDIVRPAGTVLFVALIGHKIEFDIDKVVQKELRVQGSFAYRPDDVREAFHLLSTRAVDARPLVTHEIPLGQLTEAFEQQLDRDASIKVVIRPDADADQAHVADSSVEVKLDLAHASR